MGTILELLELLTGIVYHLVISFEERVRKLVGPWMDRPAAKRLREARVVPWLVRMAWPLLLVWKVVRWFGDQGRIVQHPDGTIRPVLDYSWARLGRDLRCMASRLVSFVSRPGV